MTDSIYVAAVNSVPKGETRSFGQIAALAGKPMGARAAGRTLTSYPVDGKAAWQRAVTARGGFSIDPIRADWQLQKLRGDGARPRENEKIERWARRVGAKFIGNWRNGQCFALLDPRLSNLDPEFVERFVDEAAARARGFAMARTLELSRDLASAKRGRAPSSVALRPGARARGSPKPSTARAEPPKQEPHKVESATRRRQRKAGAT